MRHRYFRRTGDNQSGFSLVENLVSVVLLSLGSLVIAESTATAIKANSDIQAQAMALTAASRTLEPIYIRAQNPYTTTPGEADFQAVINSFAPTTGLQASGGSAVSGNQASGARDDFIVSIIEAVDAAGTNVLTTVGPYVSPVTVGVLVKYKGMTAGRQNAQGVQEASDIKEVHTSMTYVLGG